MTTEQAKIILALALTTALGAISLLGLCLCCTYTQAKEIVKYMEQIKRYEQIEYAYTNLLNRVQQPAVCLSCGSISIEHKGPTDVFKKVEVVPCSGLTSQAVKQGSGK